MTLHVYVGPTLSANEVRGLAPAAVVHPPVAHGDLLQLDADVTTTVVIIDGLFHHAASVRHKEILELLARGTRVVGCSSMGALRAAELDHFGMVGNGVIFGMYRDGVIDADDEVAVAHGDAPDHRQFSTPLITFRHLAVRASRDAIIDNAAAERILSLIRALPYPERSWRAAGVAVRTTAPELVPAWERLVEFARHEPRGGDVKSADAIDTLVRLDELTRGPLPSRQWATTSTWRSLHLDDWLLRQSGRWVEGIRVGDGEVLRYQQLYRPGFPAIWRRFALAHIAGSGPYGDRTEADLLADAADVAALWSLTSGSVTQALKDYWTTPAEQQRMSPADILLLILVRSYDDAWAPNRLVAAEPGLLAEEVAQRAVAESHVTNDEVASWGPTLSTVHLKTGELSRRLVADWGLAGSDDRERLAAARDRGFGSFTEAVEATRPFFLCRYLFDPPAAPEVT